MRDPDAAPSTPQEPLKLYRCVICSTRWLLWPDTVHGGGWNLLDRFQRPGSCCDNVAMGDQVQHLRDFDLGLASSASVAPQGWQPMETAPHDAEVFFWCVPKTAEESYTDTSGHPIVSIRQVSYLHRGKLKTWSGLSKATHWRPLPAPPSAEPSEPIVVPLDDPRVPYSLVPIPIHKFVRLQHAGQWTSDVCAACGTPESDSHHEFAVPGETTTPTPPFIDYFKAYVEYTTWPKKSFAAFAREIWDWIVTQQVTLDTVTKQVEHSNKTAEERGKGWQEATRAAHIAEAALADLRARLQQTENQLADRLVKVTTFVDGIKNLTRYEAEEIEEAPRYFIDAKDVTNLIEDFVRAICTLAPDEWATQRK